MNICLIFNERPVLNRLRPVWTSNQSRPVLIGFLRSLIGPVQFFEVLGLWWTGLGLGLSPWGSKTETGPDFQSLALSAFRKCLSLNSFGIIVGEFCRCSMWSGSMLLSSSQAECNNSMNSAVTLNSDISEWRPAVMVSSCVLLVEGPAEFNNSGLR